APHRYFAPRDKGPDRHVAARGLPDRRAAGAARRLWRHGHFPSRPGRSRHSGERPRHHPGGRRRLAAAHRDRNPGGQACRPATGSEMMALEVGNLLQSLIGAGEGLGSDVWNKMKNFAIPELHKIAVQIAAIAEHITDYTPEGAKALFDMQVKASIGLIAGMTEMTLLAVQTAINAILNAVRGFVNGAIGF